MGGRILGQRTIVVAACVATAGMLHGCAAGSGGFEPASVDRGTALGNLLAFNSLKAPAPDKPLVDTEEKPSCPEIEVLDGTAASRTYGPGEQSNATVRYQFSMGEVVRECSHVGDQLVLKVGIEGRALLGPLGTAGGFAAPVRIAIRDERQKKAVQSKLYQVPVTIPAGETGAPFSIVADPVAVPYYSAQSDNDYTIVVGFDPKGDGQIGGKPVGAKRRRVAKAGG